MYPEASCYSVLCCGAVKYLVYVIGIFMKKILSLDFDCTWYSITRSLTYLVPDIFLYGNRYTGTVYDVCITPPGAFFPRSIARQPKRCPSRTTRLRKALGEMLPMPTFLAPALFQLWRYRARKIGPGGVIYTVVVYGTQYHDYHYYYFFCPQTMCRARSSPTYLA